MKEAITTGLIRMALAGVLAVGVAAVAEMAPPDEEELDGGSGTLVFWNRLGSAEELQNSSIGPNALRYTGSFVPGRFGDALALDV
ncbi:MAG: hypothetical protein PHR35_11825, partial [Kiritimatiellae bacterium]|nr:hypothetical protein [Kiritimatiellia bacterium]